jgi:hypothetical protein
MTKNQLILGALLILGGIFLASGLGEYLFHFHGNQYGYFVYGIRLFDQSFIENDWLTWNTLNQHFAFGYLLYLIQYIGSLEFLTSLIEIILLCVFSVSVYIISKQCSKYPLHVWLSTIFVGSVVFTSTNVSSGLGSQVLLEKYFIAADIATILMILGLSFMLTKRYLFAGLAIGIGGIFHAAIMVSYSPVILILSIVIGVFQNKKSTAYFVMPILLFWGWFTLLLLVYMHSNPSNFPAISSVMAQLRNPGDLIISNWPLNQTIGWFGLMGIGLLSNSKSNASKSIHIGLQTIVIICILSMLQMEFVKNNLISSLMLFRVAPLGVLFAFILIFSRLFVLFFELEKKDFQWRDWWLIISLVMYALYQSVTSVYIGLLIFSLLSSFYFFRMFEVIMKSITSIFSFELLNYRFTYRSFVILMLVSLLILGTFKNLVGLNKHYSDRGNYTNSGHYYYPYEKAEFEMAQWIRDNTPVDAIFTIPLDIQTFRINAQRAVVVDWVMSPSIPGDLEEWYRRIGDTSGIDIHKSKLVPSMKQLIDGYRKLDYTRAKLLQKKYGTSYFVVNKNHLHINLEKFDELYSNELYKIIFLTNQ